jgi:hypothetical protein
VELMLHEIKRGPDTSGTSLQATFSDTRAPRLALLAAEVETAQNAVIHFVELLWGNPRPQGEVKWPREFRLVDPTAAAREFYEIVQMSQVRSATLDAHIMMQAADARNFVGNDETRKKIEDELKASAEAQAKINLAPVPTPGQPGLPGDNGGRGTSGRPGRSLAPVGTSSQSSNGNGNGRTTRRIVIKER